MRTRRSPRNQEILFKALFKPKDVVCEPVVSKVCFNCRHYPKQGRSHGMCGLNGTKTSGMAMKPCFVER